MAIMWVVGHLLDAVLLTLLSFGRSIRLSIYYINPIYRGPSMPIFFRICTYLCCYSLTECVWTVVSGVQYCSMITYYIQERSGISIDDVIINCIFFIFFIWIFLLGNCTIPGWTINSVHTTDPSLTFTTHTTFNTQRNSSRNFEPQARHNLRYTALVENNLRFRSQACFGWESNPGHFGGRPTLYRQCYAPHKLY
jgi:hypothetical protein